MKNLLFFILGTLLVSCHSVEKYNARLEKKIPAELLKQDVDYAYRQLLDYHPDLDWFITEDSLRNTFTALKNSINRSMTSKEFYFDLQAVIAQIRQAHTYVDFPSRKYAKREEKKRKNTIGPFSQFRTNYSEEGLYVVPSKADDVGLPVGISIVEVNGYPVKDYYQKYRKLETSDGYNETFIDRIMSKSFSTFFTYEHGLKDSLRLTFDKNDSLFVKTVYRKKLDESKSIKTKDSLHLTRKERKQRELKNFYFGYDKINKQFAIELQYPTQDSTIAVLNIRSFVKGYPKKAYAEVFEKLKQSNVQYLILDLRDNGGGYLRDSGELFSYLSDSAIAFTQKAHITQKNSLAKNYHKMFSGPRKYTLMPLWLGASIATIFKTKKDQNGDYLYTISSSKPKKIKENNYRGVLYVLQNGGSYSATSILISMLDQYTNAVFVGEESGGNYNGTIAGFIVPFTLPNSQLELNIPLMTICPNLKNQHRQGRGNFPDFIVETTLDDIFYGRDPVLDTALRLINSE
ncbi:MULTISPECIES: S41 family peptidase [Weeksella]|uniref:S41 family peptidase n=1 Tax=Weeksella TaxID=1013 RepID=UPI0008A5A89A|nr:MULTISPECIES: S41 family peptidase [Weeksella]MDK7375316.1 S41 family peptidase [Weeksella virosa]OFM84761.1 hypothetical protein HMPREF2660_01155 [Weeksella sp. HMSC059D05]